MQRRLPLAFRPRSGSACRASKSSASSPTLPGTCGARRLPAEPAGDHQVDDEEQLALGVDHDALAEARHARRPCVLRRPRAAGRPIAGGRAWPDAPARYDGPRSAGAGRARRDRRRATPACAKVEHPVARCATGCKDCGATSGKSAGAPAAHDHRDGGQAKAEKGDQRRLGDGGGDYGKCHLAYPTGRGRVRSRLRTVAHVEAHIAKGR